MAKSAPKKKTRLETDAFDIEIRAGDGIGFGRYTAVQPDSDRKLNVLVLAPGDPGKAQVQWAQKLAVIEHRTFPGVVEIGGEEGQPWVAFAHVDGNPLSGFIVDENVRLAEIESLHVIMQLAAILQTIHVQGLAHGNLSAECVLLSPSAGQLFEVSLVGWKPYAEDDKGQQQWVAEDLKALGQLFYQMLTGVLPPSAQADDEANLEGQTSGAFDDVLMDWIEEDRDLKGLGGPALEAMADTSSFADVSAFMEALLPHFRDHLQGTIETTGRALDEDRAFMTEVERQRARVRELASRQQFIQDWLEERRDRIDQCDQVLEEHVSRLRGLETLQTEVAFMLGQSATSSGHAIDNVLSSWTTSGPIEGLLDDGETYPENEPASSEDDVLDPSAIVEAPVLDIDEDEPTDTAYDNLKEPADGRIGLNGALLALIVAIVFGALGAAFFLYDEGDAPRPQPKVTVSTDSPPVKTKPRKSESSPAVSVPASKDNVPPPPTQQTSKAKAVAIATKSQEVDAAIQKPVTKSTADATVSPTPENDASRQVPESVKKPDNIPKGMKWIPGGTLRLGLTQSQVDTLKRRCLRASPKLKAQCKVNSIESQPPKATQEIASFFMDEFEISQGAYDRCVRAGRCRPNRTRWQKVPYLPASQVSHQMARQFCSFRNGALPTAEQWLYAARGPDNTRIYPWGDEAPLSGRTARANFGQSRLKTPGPDKRDGQLYASPVEAYTIGRSPFGVLNLSGNVREWTQTVDGEKGTAVVGGSWRQRPTDLRVTRIEYVSPKRATNDLGFRCVVMPEEVKQ